ncbi:hypothetical protein CMV_015282 [Castanea mollissima]|uniref:Uncharacterized protein n=1 Tax=Castanea mollissima TaxID=60419 RepID=A0A8J4R9D7_9ROSI|nr:hypothetical protein CMV_015282 [Castanea mollissima]
MENILNRHEVERLSNSWLTLGQEIYRAPTENIVAMEENFARKNEHKSFLSSMISRRNYIELKKKKTCNWGKTKVSGNLEKIAQGKNEYQAFFIHCSLEEVLNSEKEIQLWFKLKKYFDAQSKL